MVILQNMKHTHSNILIVDDDRELSGMLKEYLQGHGLQVTLAENGKEMDQFLAATQADLILLDLMLPGEDGLSIARRLCASLPTPIIIMSARGEDIDRIVGLEIGADDYLSKPFNPRELLARVRAVLRRLSQPEASPPENTITFGPFRLDLGSHQLNRDGDEIPLTTGEFTLLKIFAQHPNRVLNRDELSSLAEGYERIPFDRSIDVRVTRLRRKIEPDISHPKYIRTVWGAGYLFSPQPETPSE